MTDNTVENFWAIGEAMQEGFEEGMRRAVADAPPVKEYKRHAPFAYAMLDVLQIASFALMIFCLIKLAS